MQALKVTLACIALSAAMLACPEPVQFPVYEHDYVQSEFDSVPLDGGKVTSDGGTSEDGSQGDAVAVDVQASDVLEEDTEKPELKSAFSTTQGVITARFSEPIVQGGDELTNFTIKASNNQPLEILNVSQTAATPQYVELYIDASGINPDLEYTLTVKKVEDGAGNVIAVGKNSAVISRTLLLNIVWHQHQPLYLDPVSDSLTGPWVRKHATKDYYDMTSILEDYPDVHVNVNLTSVLLRQLLDFYVKRLDPFIDVYANTMDVEGFKAVWGGKTDPFVDFLLKETPSADTISEEELLLVWKGAWTLVSTADPIMKHFPEYVALRDANRAEYDTEDFLGLKVFFELAWFDPDFLNGPVTLPDGSVTRVHEWLVRNGETYTLAVPPSEQLAVDLLIENHKIMRNVIAIHKKLFYDVDSGVGQVEVTTTPMYHPILPLIYDTNLMGTSQPFDPKPEPAFSYPEDASAQVLRSVAFYEGIFGIKPRGIWCGEGSVAEEIVPILTDAGFEWTATDHEVLKRSLQNDNAPVYKGYKVDSDTSQGSSEDAMLILFRHTDLSDRMGFEYKTWKGVDAAQDFIDDLVAMAPALGGDDRLVTVVLDGENAWEMYTQEHDGKGFLHALYAKLSEAYQRGEITTVTTSEYIHGNPSRAITAHPIGDHQELEPLWPGSWIGATFAVWIGELEENKAWEYLRKARSDLQASGLAAPNPLAPPPMNADGLAGRIYRAYDQIYAAEGSDWFWWYGVDQTTPANDDSPFDLAFRSQLLGMYEQMNAALKLLGQPEFPVPDFAPLIQAKPKLLEGPYDDAFPSPTIDGAFVPNESEWTPPGGFFFDSDSSTAISNTDDISTVYYGVDENALYVAVQASEDLSSKVGTPYSVAVLIDHKTILDAELGTSSSDPAHAFTPPGEDFVGMQVARRVRADFSGAAVKVVLEESDGQGGFTSSGAHSVTLGGPQFGGIILEFKIPFADLNLQGAADPLNFYVVAIEGDEVIDAAPSLKSKRVFDDITNLVFVTFEVDATGEQIPLESIGFKELPSPAGNAQVFIVGKADKLGDWIPNKIGLSDSGKGGDKESSDGMWTGTYGFPRGEVVRYKYTVGTGTDEGQWPGTEEFPFTNRQYVVPDDPLIKKVVISDVLGDDPPQENSLGKYTQVTTYEE